MKYFLCIRKLNIYSGLETFYNVVIDEEIPEWLEKEKEWIRNVGDNSDIVIMSAIELK